MSSIAGVRVRGPVPAADLARLLGYFSDTGLLDAVERADGVDARGAYFGIRLCPDAAQAWVPGADTSGLARALGLAPVQREADLDTEILAALLAAPIPFDFPSVDEWLAAVRVRCRVVLAGRRTLLAFDTEQAERPDCWFWSEATGFILRPGHELIPALQRTLWPDLSGQRYSFSCYRATEYVLLLALAQELAVCHPAALAALQAQWQVRAIQSAAFHEAFLREYGSLQAPLPAGYCVPGDRLWFRNPDPVSANVPGYEGSWVFYLGEGHFTNFWKPDEPYTLQSKCVELYHWRHGVRHEGGRPYVDETVVEARVARTQGDPDALQRILGRMMRLRDPGGVQASGGCIDASREALRCLLPVTCELALDGVFGAAA